ncbi:hypothetical protein L0152_07260 [bacterium]|nr:hypothetical protein [bacterium]
MKKLYRIKNGCSVGFKQPGQEIELEESDAQIHIDAGRIEEVAEPEAPKKKAKSKGE